MCEEMVCGAECLSVRSVFKAAYNCFSQSQVNVFVCWYTVMLQRQKFITLPNWARKKINKAAMAICFLNPVAIKIRILPEVVQ